MNDVQIVWDLEEDSDGNVQHILQHGITMDEVLLDPDSNTTLSRSSERLITFGYTSGNRYIAVVWEHIMDDPLMMRPITAYDVPEPRAR